MVLGLALVRSGASQPWDGRGTAAGGPGPCTGLASSLVPAVAPVRAACLHSVINSGGQLTCSKLTRGRLFRGGHVDPCQVRGPACGAVRPSGPLGKHRLSWWLPTKEQGKGQEEKQEEAKAQGSGKAEGEADRGRQRGEVQEAQEGAVGGSRPSRRAAVAVDAASRPPGQAREAARRVFRAA